MLGGASDRCPGLAPCPTHAPPKHHAFSAVRANAALQLRQVCGMLAEGRLPLAHPAVHTLLCAALYQVGPLLPRAGAGAGLATALAWKEELLASGDSGTGGLGDALRVELASVVDELQAKSSEHTALLFAADPAAYLRSFAPGCGRMRGVRAACAAAAGA